MNARPFATRGHGSGEQPYIGECAKRGAAADHVVLGGVDEVRGAVVVLEQREVARLGVVGAEAAAVLVGPVRCGGHRDPYARHVVQRAAKPTSSSVSG